MRKRDKMIKILNEYLGIDWNNKMIRTYLTLYFILYTLMTLCGIAFVFCVGMAINEAATYIMQWMESLK